MFFYSSSDSSENLALGETCQGVCGKARRIAHTRLPALSPDRSLSHHRRLRKFASFFPRLTEAARSDKENHSGGQAGSRRLILEISDDAALNSPPPKRNAIGPTESNKKTLSILTRMQSQSLLSRPSHAQPSEPCRNSVGIGLSHTLVPSLHLSLTLSCPFVISITALVEAGISLSAQHLFLQHRHHDIPSSTSPIVFSDATRGASLPLSFE